MCNLNFMPAEQGRDATLTDARSDLWSLAATLYQMVTGEPPRVIDLDAVPQELRQTLARALKSKKDDREARPPEDATCGDQCGREREEAAWTADEGGRMPVAEVR